MKNERRVDFFGVIMNVVQVIGMTLSVILLKHFTLLPLWACLLIGIPLFLFVFFVMVAWACRGGRLG